MIKRVLKWLLAAVVVLALVTFLFAPAQVEKAMNQVQQHAKYQISPEAARLHDSLIIGDWHADSTLWNRDLAKRSSIGHVDIPRLQAGNVALQMFTTVTKSPSDLNYEYNKASGRDDITALAIVQLWPLATWNNLTARALYQAEKISDLAKRDKENFRLIKSQAELQKLLALRQSKPAARVVGGLIGTEGSHALDGKLENIQRLFDHGFRMMSLQHFFDNRLGGSLHGESQAGLSEWGRTAMMKMQALDIIVDLSHSSERVVEDVLALADKPLVISHTGFKGHCDSPRNIRDDLMVKIAKKGGVVAVGFWQGAVCGNHPTKVAEAIRYGIQLLGEDHVALGSDFDGSVTTAFDASELAVLTQALLDIGVNYQQIRKVMGGNMLRFLLENLPE